MGFIDLIFGTKREPGGMCVNINRNRAIGAQLDSSMYIDRFSLEDLPGVRHIPGGGTRYLDAALRPYRGCIIDARLVSRFDVRSKPDGWRFLSDKSFIVDMNGTLLASVDDWRIKKSASWPIPFRVGDRVLALVTPMGMSAYDVIMFPRTDTCTMFAPYVWRPLINLEVGAHAWEHDKGGCGILKGCRVKLIDTGASKVERISVESPDGALFTMTSRSGGKFDALKMLAGEKATVIYESSRNAWSYRVSILSINNEAFSNAVASPVTSAPPCPANDIGGRG